MGLWRIYSNSLQIRSGTPPGAPLFQLFGRVFTLFASQGTSEVAVAINVLSALCSAFTILFLFWTITAFGRKLFFKREEVEIVKNNTKYNKKNFLKKIEIFFKRRNYLININELEKQNFEQLINALCMISPISVVEKQKLIETTSTKEKIQLFENIINFNLADKFKNKTIQ